MPKVILSHSHYFPDILSVGREIQKLVAVAASTSEVTLTTNDVDFIPVKNGSLSLVPDIGIEIETIGFPARKEKLSQKEVVLKLKQDILAIPGFPKIDPSIPLIWIKFWDPAGLHV